MEMEREGAKGKSITKKINGQRVFKLFEIKCTTWEKHSETLQFFLVKIDVFPKKILP